MPKIEAGAVVIMILHSPREKVWGVLSEITAAGAFVRAIDLNAFDDYVASIVRNEPFINLADQFFPLWRVERIERDAESMGIPSLAEQFERRTNRKIADV